MEITSKNIRMCSRLGQRGAVFGVAIPELAKKYNNIKVITADLGLTSGLERYKTAYPDKFLNVGIAEQNMIGMKDCCGNLLKTTSPPFAYTYFLVSSFVLSLCKM